MTNFQNSCTAAKRMKFATSSILQYPRHLRHIATVPWEIKNSNFLQIFSRYGRKCKQILIFSVFKITSLSPYRLQIKFSMSLFFYLFTFVINLWHRKFITTEITAVFVNNQHGISNEDKILKSL